MLDLEPIKARVAQVGMPGLGGIADAMDDRRALVAEVERLRVNVERLLTQRDDAAREGDLALRQCRAAWADATRLRRALEDSANALTHYATMDWMPDSDERGEVARDALEALRDAQGDD